MDLPALFRRQAEAQSLREGQEREAPGKVRSRMPFSAFLVFNIPPLTSIQAPVIIDDEDDEDFQGPASLLKAKRNGRGAGASSKRKRARIQDDSDGSWTLKYLKYGRHNSSKFTQNQKMISKH